MRHVQPLGCLNANRVHPKIPTASTAAMDGREMDITHDLVRSARARSSSLLTGNVRSREKYMRRITRIIGALVLLGLIFHLSISATAAQTTSPSFTLQAGGK